MTLRFIVLFFVFFSVLKSQNGFQIEIAAKNIKHDSVELAIYASTSKKHFVVKETAVSKKSSLEENQKIISAIYRLQFSDDESNYVNLAIDNGAQFKIKLDNNLRRIETKDPLNTLFIQAQNTLNIEQRDKLWEEIVSKYPESVAALYAKLELKQTSQQIELANEEKKKNYRNNFFNDIDLDDKRLPLLPNFYSSLFYYVRILPINNDNYKSSVDLLLKGQDCNSRNYMKYLDWIFKNLEYYSRYKMYDSYSYVFNTYLNKGDCIYKNEKFYKAVVASLQNYEKLPIGAEIPSFEMIDSDNKRYTIDELYPKSDYTFIAFYDPDCSHCKQKMPEINNYFDDLKASDSSVNVQQIAFLNATSDYAWQDFIDKNHLNNWMHVKSDDTSYKYIKDLDVFANPAFFLVNRKGEILMKNFNPTEIKNIIYKN